MGLVDFILSRIQYLLPHHSLSRLVHGFMHSRIQLIKNLQIWIYGWLAGVNWAEARYPRAVDHLDFNAFFTRELAAGMRTVDPDPLAFVSPRLPLPAVSRSRGIETVVVTVCAGVVPLAGIVKLTGTCSWLPKICTGVMNCVPEK